MLKALLLAGASMLAVAATSAEAGTVTFGTPGEYTWTAPSAGTYEIDVWGAQGGASANLYFPTFQGGAGAGVWADFSLKAGQNLSIFVGQKGGAASLAPGYYHGGGGGGGGGASAVLFGKDPFGVIAGGGGGAGGAGAGGAGQAPAQYGPGADGFGVHAGSGGFRGYAGGYGSSGAAPGGGFFSYSRCGWCVFGGGGFVYGGHGGIAGFKGDGNGGSGFAGGGGGGWGGGGGGGGISGGGGGGYDRAAGYNTGGGGGGSYVFSPLPGYLGFWVDYPGPQGVLGPNFGDGKVRIALLPAAVPEPSEWMLMILGLAFTGHMLRRERWRRARAGVA